MFLILILSALDEFVSPAVIKSGFSPNIPIFGANLELALVSWMCSCCAITTPRSLEAPIKQQQGKS